MILAHTGGFRSGADYRTLFGEHIDSRGLAPALEILGLALVGAGVFVLALSSVGRTDPAL